MINTCKLIDNYIYKNFEYEFSTVFKDYYV